MSLPPWHGKLAYGSRQITCGISSSPTANISIRAGSPSLTKTCPRLGATCRSLDRKEQRPPYDVHKDANPRSMIACIN